MTFRENEPRPNKSNRNETAPLTCTGSLLLSDVELLGVGSMVTSAGAADVPSTDDVALALVDDTGKTVDEMVGVEVGADMVLVAAVVAPSPVEVVEVLIELEVVELAVGAGVSSDEGSTGQVEYTAA